MFTIKNFIEELETMVENNATANQVMAYAISYIQLEILRGNLIINGAKEQKEEQTESE